jgi:hypothetical protein
MPRRTFFSFHHERDIFRVSQIRNCGVFKAGDSQPFLDHAAWEEVRLKGHLEVKRWIDYEMSGSSVLVVCIGSETFERTWVRYEIRKAHFDKKGILGIRIHNMKSINKKTASIGVNPLDITHITEDNKEICCSEIYKTYDWVNDNGRENIEKWIEEAAIKAGR